MGARIGIVQIGHHPNDVERLSAMYGELLGMRPIFIGYHKLIHEDGHTPEIGFEDAPDDPRPRWPDPAHPQQIHLDIAARDIDRAEQMVIAHGATPLRRTDGHRIFADPAGHPFCLYHRPTAPEPARIERIVFDCANPEALAAFYQAFLDLDEAGTLAFQHSTAEPPRWPDPAHPAQLHLDLSVDGRPDLDVLERLGAVPLTRPGQADHVVYADPAGHPFCAGIRGWLTPGPAQVAKYEAWASSGRG